MLYYLQCFKSKQTNEWEGPLSELDSVRAFVISELVLQYAKQLKEADRKEFDKTFRETSLQANLEQKQFINNALVTMIGRVKAGSLKLKIQLENGKEHDESVEQYIETYFGPKRLPKNLKDNKDAFEGFHSDIIREKVKENVRQKLDLKNENFEEDDRRDKREVQGEYVISLTKAFYVLEIVNHAGHVPMCGRSEIWDEYTQAMSKYFNYGIRGLLAGVVSALGLFLNNLSNNNDWNNGSSRNILNGLLIAGLALGAITFGIFGFSHTTGFTRKEQNLYKKACSVQITEELGALARGIDELNQEVLKQEDTHEKDGSEKTKTIHNPLESMLQKLASFLHNVNARDVAILDEDTEGTSSNTSESEVTVDRRVMNNTLNKMLGNDHFECDRRVIRNPQNFGIRYKG